MSSTLDGNSKFFHLHRELKDFLEKTLILIMFKSIYNMFEDEGLLLFLK